MTTNQDLIEILRTAQAEIVHAGHNGWGNAIDAAIAALSAEPAPRNELVEQFLTEFKCSNTIICHEDDLRGLIAALSPPPQPGCTVNVTHHFDDRTLSGSFALPARSGDAAREERFEVSPEFVREMLAAWPKIGQAHPRTATHCIQHIAHQAIAFFKRAAKGGEGIPEELFDGYAVLNEIEPCRHVSADHVALVLDAVVGLIRKRTKQQ